MVWKPYPGIIRSSCSCTASAVMTPGSGYIYSPYVAAMSLRWNSGRGIWRKLLPSANGRCEELSQEKRLYAYGRLLEWKQRLVYRPGADRTGAAAIAALAERVAKPKVRPR